MVGNDDVLQNIDQRLRDLLAGTCLRNPRLILDPDGRLDDVPDELPRFLSTFPPEVGALFLATRDGKPVGRIAAIEDRNYNAFHGSTTAATHTRSLFRGTIMSQRGTATCCRMRSMTSATVSPSISNSGRRMSPGAAKRGCGSNQIVGEAGCGWSER